MFTLLEPMGANEQASMSREELAAYSFEQHGKVDVVCVGLDNEFNYRKLCIAKRPTSKIPRRPPRSNE